MTARSGPARGRGKRKARMGSEASVALKKAHAHKAGAEFVEAAAIFSELATRAESRGEHRMATHLAYQAGKCQFRAGDKDAGKAMIELAIGHAGAAEDRQKVARKFGRLLAMLRDNDMGAEADEILASVKERLSLTKMPKQGDPPPVNRAMRRALPKVCGTCGAKVDTNQIFFNDDSSADCRFCGTVLAG